MSARTWVQLATVVLAFAFGACLVGAWYQERQERTQLQQELRAAHAQVTAANARQQQRDVSLQQQLARLQQLQTRVQKPADVIKALPSVLPLPKPLVIDQPPAPATDGDPQARPPAPPTPEVRLPLEDLKPLYDSALACKECQAQLAAAQADLKDEHAKTDALSRERDDALRAAKGGSAFRRVARAAKWFLVGAAAGAVAVKLAR